MTQKSSRFEEDYPDPVIENRRKSPIPGLIWFTVFDRSQLAEDPITPHLWIENSEGLKFRHPYEISAALNSIDFDPKTEETAREAVKLYFYGLPYSPEVLNATRMKATKKQFELGIRGLGKNTSGWRFSVFAWDHFPRITRGAHSSQQKSSVINYEFVIGKGVYQVKETNVWSE